MKKILLLLFVILPILCSAQIVVESCALLESDQTANTPGTERYDQNGDRCALLKIETTQHGFSFDVGTLGVTAVEEQNSVHPAEIWVYVPARIKKITIQHGTLGTLRDYDFAQAGVTIQKARTYLLRLKTGVMHQYVEHAVQEKYLVFDVYPEGAVVEVEGLDWPLGELQMRVRYGTYKYRVSAPDYHPAAGVIAITDDGKVNAAVEVKLKPAFGWIYFASDKQSEGAKIFLDDRYVGVVPMLSQPLPSGKHKIKIVKSMYSAQEQTITVVDEDTTRVNARLAANYATITLKAPDGVEIWVDGSLQGVGTWSGPLSAGEYVLETRAPHHRNRSMTKQVTLAMDGQTIELAQPFPIHGSLDVRSNPRGATVYLDGVAIGETPFLVGKILEGPHYMEVKKEGYSVYTQDISVSEAQTTSVSCTLESGREITLSTNVEAEWEVDGRSLGKSKSHTIQMTYGKHDIVATANGYISLRTTAEVAGDVKILKYDLLPESRVRIFEGAHVANVFYYYNGKNIEVEYDLNRNTNVTLVGTSNSRSGDIDKTLSQGRHSFSLVLGTGTINATIDASSSYNKYAARNLHTIEHSLMAIGSQSMMWKDARTYGAMYIQTYDGHGWYLKLRSSFSFASANGDVEISQDGGLHVPMSDGQGYSYFPTGKRSISSHSLSFGYAVDFLRLAYASGNRFNKVGMYLGSGVGYSSRYHEVYGNDGTTEWLRQKASGSVNSPWGAVIDAGLYFGIYGLTLSVGYSGLNFVTDNHIEVGLGWTF